MSTVITSAGSPFITTKYASALSEPTSNRCYVPALVSPLRVVETNRPERSKTSMATPGRSARSNGTVMVSLSDNVGRIGRLMRSQLQPMTN